jgi:hypothetical protein
MTRAFDLGVKEFGTIYNRFLNADTREGLAALTGQDPESFAMPVDLWVKVVYEFAAAYHHRLMNPDHLLRSLTPLYLGRTAAWVVAARDFGSLEVEQELDHLCERFEALKPHLHACWREGKESK